MNMEASDSFTTSSLDEIMNKGWAIGPSKNNSELLQLGYNNGEEPWVDKDTHLHKHSEEWYIVLGGRLEIEIEGQIVKVGPRAILGVRKGVPHRVIGGRGPIEEFTVRVPSIEDKQSVKQ